MTMLVAAFSVHWSNGWHVIAHQGSEASQRLQGFLSWLEDAHPGQHQLITELGQPVILNNGVEYAVTYFIMLMTLFFIGSGRYLSLDYWLYRCGKHFCPHHKKT